jgi:hypothetical protein
LQYQPRLDIISNYVYNEVTHKLTYHQSFYGQIIINPKKTKRLDALMIFRSHKTARQGGFFSPLIKIVND